MTYKVVIAKAVIVFLKTQSPAFNRKALTIFEKLAENPFVTHFDIKKMQGFSGHYRLRLGKIRFLYEIKEQEILIFVYKSGFRGDVYK